MVRQIFRLERVARQSPLPKVIESRPLAVVGRLVGWLRDDVFARYELVERDTQRVKQNTNNQHLSDECHARPERPRPPTARWPSLRIVVVHDASASSTEKPTRMVISGRMADVCAELDRLAA